MKSIARRDQKEIALSNRILLAVTSLNISSRSRKSTFYIPQLCLEFLFCYQDFRYNSIIMMK